MSQPIGRAVLVLSGLGFPLTQLVIRRFGQPAVVVQTVRGGLLVRDVTMIAAGVPDRLRRGPRPLLWLEAAAGVAAIETGLRPVLDATALHLPMDRAAPISASMRGERPSGRSSGWPGRCARRRSRG